MQTIGFEYSSIIAGKSELVSLPLPSIEYLVLNHQASIYERGHLLGPGDIAVVIPLRGYAPGQTINVDIKENIWNQQMSFKYVVQLVQVKFSLSEVIPEGKYNTNIYR